MFKKIVLLASVLLSLAACRASIDIPEERQRDYIIVY